ncbi:MAG: hypothetical protein RIR00_1260 [Pseudomonadota bacterium]|jgi:rhodanese-related sulfurtransferase
MRRWLAGILMSTLTLGVQAEVIDIDNAELARLMEQKVPIIDIRTAPEWQETGVVPGSHLLTFFDEQGRADPAAWLGKARHIAGPEQPVILICRSGNRTRAAGQFLSEKAGYRKVYNVRSGIRAWIAEGRVRQSSGDALASCRAKKTC